MEKSILVAISILVGAFLGIITNLVSGMIQPYMEKRKKLTISLFMISKSPFSLEAGAPLGVEHQLPSRDRRTIDPGPHPPRQGSRQGSQPWQGWGDRDWQQTNTPQPTNKNLLPSRTLISRSPYIYTVATRPRRDHKSGVLHAWDAGAVGGSGVRVPRVILQGLATSS